MLGVVRIVPNPSQGIFGEFDRLLRKELILHSLQIAVRERLLLIGESRVSLSGGVRP
jgi:hypothetical protein